MNDESVERVACAGRSHPDHGDEEFCMYSWRNLRHGTDRIGELFLTWEARGDPVSDNYDLHDASARDLWRIWRSGDPVDEQAEAVWGRGAVRITWYVSGEVFEGAPYAINVPGYKPETFLDYFTTPIDITTGEPIQWTRLPVEDKLWRDGRLDKGGFIQEATGWKPSALQPVFWPDQLADACGLFVQPRP